MELTSDLGRAKRQRYLRNRAFLQFDIGRGVSLQYGQDKSETRCKRGVSPLQSWRLRKWRQSPRSERLMVSKDACLTMPSTSVRLCLYCVHGPRERLGGPLFVLAKSCYSSVEIATHGSCTFHRAWSLAGGRPCIHSSV